MKSDFINNMTHEFKTPISTISLASEILLNSGDEPSIDRIKKYSKIIYDENQRMRGQVERVLSMAAYDREEGYKLKKTRTDVHELIQNTIDNFLVSAEENRLEVEYQLNAAQHILNIDEMHITNVISNVADNAAKYSKSNPKLIITSGNLNGGIVLSFKDYGIGISSEDQKHIFEKFFRVSTGNLHDIKGFGLGLHYVKTMVEAHGGSINVESEVNKGSCFNVYLPIDNGIDK
ncbi:MAG: HAMP domain-containing histidine kinase [Bacteroidales bacterium]|nr:HAMP domain-containing histidine kinase [Bacteroidales bacterium]